MREELHSKQKYDPANLSAAKDETIHVFLNHQNEATFHCASCGNALTRDLSKVVHVQSAIRIRCKCKCGNVFRVLVERRRNYRKIVNLLGMWSYLDTSGQTQRRLIKIIDISITGLHFSTNSLPEFKVGQKIIVEFKLDNTNNTEIKESAIVKRIQTK
jgi:hypothetical protein